MGDHGLVASYGPPRFLFFMDREKNELRTDIVEAIGQVLISVEDRFMPWEQAKGVPPPSSSF